MDVPAEAMGEVKAAVAAHVAAHPGDFAVDAEVNAFVIACSDPLKLQLGVFVQYAHNGGWRQLTVFPAFDNSALSQSV